MEKEIEADWEYRYYPPMGTYELYCPETGEWQNQFGQEIVPPEDCLE